MITLMYFNALGNSRRSKGTFDPIPRFRVIVANQVKTAIFGGWFEIAVAGQVETTMLGGVCRTTVENRMEATTSFKVVG